MCYRSDHCELLESITLQKSIGEKYYSFKVSYYNNVLMKTVVCIQFRKASAHVCLKQKGGWLNELFTGMQYGNSIIMNSVLRSPLATPGRVSICLFLW